MTIEIITAVALGIGLSASAGFRVFVPMLVASAAAYFGWIPLNDGFEWLGSLPTLIVCAVAVVVEIAAYYIPFVDNLLDTISTPLAVIAGTLLMTSVMPIDNNLLRWVTSFIVGGGASAAIQTGTALTRGLSTGTTAGLGNPIVATGENVAAVGFSIGSILLPIVVAVLVIGLIIYGFNKFGRRLFGGTKPEETL